MSRRLKYPGEDYVKSHRSSPDIHDDEPDILTVSGFCPNYDKYPDKSPEELLAWLNLD